VVKDIQWSFRWINRFTVVSKTKRLWVKDKQSDTFQ